MLEFSPRLRSRSFASAKHSSRPASLSESLTAECTVRGLMSDLNGAGGIHLRQNAAKHPVFEAPFGIALSLGSLSHLRLDLALPFEPPAGYPGSID